MVLIGLSRLDVLYVPNLELFKEEFNRILIHLCLGTCLQKSLEMLYTIVIQIFVYILLLREILSFQYLDQALFASLLTIPG